MTDGADCDDSDASSFPGGTEVSDHADNDCDGATDEGVTSTYWADSDSDGYGDPTNTTEDCSPPSGYVLPIGDGDCDDHNPYVHPGRREVCDGKDDDCDEAVDEGVDLTIYADSDGDGYGDPTTAVSACSVPAGYIANGLDCDDSDPAVNPSASEACNPVDDDCDGAVDDGC